MARTRRWSLLTVAAMVLGVACAVSASTPDQALAQSGQDCYEMRWVIIGEKENGDPLYGWKVVNICESGGGGGSGGGGPNTCEHPTYGEFPCFEQGRGWWSGTQLCYVSYLSPQPPAGHGDWDGHDPDEGAVYELYCPRGVSGTERFARRTEFFAEAPDLPSVSQLAQQAMEALPLAEADVGIAPGPDGAGLVGLPVWMWTNNTAATWGPVSVSVPGPGITVTAEGNATQIEWNMGDGTTVVCESPGIPYEARYGDQHSPDCGHVYTQPSRSQPDGRYTVTAITTWHVEWWVETRGSGAEGEQFFDRTSSTTVRINELQVVTS
jgi:hypothetical protein